MPYNLGSSSPSAEDISHEINLFVGETRGKLDTALTELSTLANRVYGYSHDAIIAKDLETVYADIVEDNPELAELSATAGRIDMLNAEENTPGRCRRDKATPVSLP